MANIQAYTKLSDLIIKFLKSQDSYNSGDLTLSDTDTDQDTLGERAKICLNQALHLCYDLVKDSKYLEAYPTTSLASTPNVAYIDLDSETFLDDIEAISEQTTQQIKLIKKSWSWYRRNFPSPANVTGDPVYYIRRGNRVYLGPTPSEARTYTIDFIKLTKDLSLPGDYSLLPTRYDQWVIMEAMVRWYIMEDPTSVPQLIVTERDNSRFAAMNSISTSFDMIRQAGSNCENDTLSAYAYKRPVAE